MEKKSGGAQSGCTIGAQWAVLASIIYTRGKLNTGTSINKFVS